MSFTFLSFIDKFVKQYKIRKNGAVILVFYYLLILFEVKDAYLIDHMSFPSIERLEEMLFSIHSYYQKIFEPYAIDCFRLDQMVSILLLGDDIFLVNEDRGVEPSGKILDMRDQLKEYLYGEKYKGVPVRRYDVKEVIVNSESVVKK